MNANETAQQTTQQKVQQTEQQKVQHLAQHYDLPYLFNNRVRSKEYTYYVEPGFKRWFDEKEDLYALNNKIFDIVGNHNVKAHFVDEEPYHEQTYGYGKVYAAYDGEDYTWWQFVICLAFDQKDVPSWCFGYYFDLFFNMRCENPTNIKDICEHAFATVRGGTEEEWYHYQEYKAWYEEDFKVREQIIQDCYNKTLLLFDLLDND